MSRDTAIDLFIWTVGLWAVASLILEDMRYGVTFVFAFWCLLGIMVGVAGRER